MIHDWCFVLFCLVELGSLCEQWEYHSRNKRYLGSQIRKKNYNPVAEGKNGETTQFTHEWEGYVQMICPQSVGTQFGNFPTRRRGEGWEGTGLCGREEAKLQMRENN